MEPLRLGDPVRLGDWELIGRLGQGGMGVVYFGQRSVDNRIVCAAVKTISGELLEHRTSRDRFEREISLLLGLNIPGIAKVLDMDLLGATPWYASQYIERAVDLQSHVKANGAMSADEVLALAWQMLTTLNRLQIRGIAHRDVKPNNILIAPTGPMLIDFGIAAVQGGTSYSQPNASPYTPTWCSPEQLKGEHVGPETDLYNLGLVLAFAATGRHPFGDERPATEHQIITGKEPKLEGVRPDLRAVIRALMKPNPAARRSAGLAASRAMCNAAAALAKRERWDESLALYEEVIERNSKSPDPAVRSLVSSAVLYADVARERIRRRESGGTDDGTSRTPSKGLRRTLLAMIGAVVVALSLMWARGLGAGPPSAVHTEASSPQFISIPVGSNPFGAAIAPDGDRVYIVNSSDGTMSVIDTSKNATIDTINEVGSWVRGVAIAPDGTRAYVTSYGDDVLTVVDTSTNQIAATIKVGAGPEGVAITPDGTRAYVTSPADDALSVVDIATNQVIKVVEVYRSTLRGVEISPDGTRAYVTDSDAGELIVVDTDTNLISGRIKVSEPGWGFSHQPDGLAITPDGTRAYVTNPGAGTLSVVDTVTNQTVNVVTVGRGPSGVAIAPDGTRVYVANYIDGSVSIVDAATGGTIQSIDMGFGAKPMGVVITPDGAQVYVTNDSSQGTVGVLMLASR